MNRKLCKELIEKPNLRFYLEFVDYLGQLMILKRDL
jgi:hypothetical protein